LAGAYDDLQKSGLAIVAISVDPPEASRRLKEELHLPFPLLSDVDGRVIALYALTHSAGNDGKDISRPAEYLLDENGVIRWAAFSETVNARTHPEAILEAQRRYLSPKVPARGP